MKRVIAECFFPELKGDPNRVGRGEATNTEAALSRAFKDAIKQTRSIKKGKKRAGGVRITTIKALITIINVESEEGHGESNST
jgi:hypothetical protein